MSILKPKIYVICNAAYYSKGVLHGVWIDATQAIALIKLEIEDMLSQSPIPNTEDWKIYAHGDFGGLSIEPYEDLERVSELAEFVAQYGNLGAALLMRSLGDRQKAASILKHAYIGPYANEADFARQYFDKTVSPLLVNTLNQANQEALTTFNHLIQYLDYHSYGTALLSSGAFFFIKGNNNIHIFNQA